MRRRDEMERRGKGGRQKRGKKRMKKEKKGKQKDRKGKKGEGMAVTKHCRGEARK